MRRFVIKLRDILCVALALVGISSWLFVGDALAAQPQTINYQGRLYDLNNLPLTGQYDFRFRLYDDLAKSNLLWGPEEYTNQSVVNGYFSVPLGSTESFSAAGLDFKNQYYLTVQIKETTAGVWDNETDPPVAFNSYAYSFNTQKLDNDDGFVRVGYGVLAGYKLSAGETAFSVNTASGFNGTLLSLSNDGNEVLSVAGNGGLHWMDGGYASAYFNIENLTNSEANKIRNQLGGEMKAGSGTQISGMQVGQAIIPSKRSAVDVKFNQSYDSAPIVMLTLASDSNLMRYFVSDVTANGFRLNLYPTQSNDTLFNWQAYPANGVQSDQSNVGEEAILEDLPEYEVPVIVRPPQSVFLPIVPNKEESSLNLNGAEDILYNSGLSILEVGDGLGDEIGDTEDVSDEVSTDDIPAEVIENPITPEDPEVSVEAPVTAEISETPAENLE